MNLILVQRMVSRPVGKVSSHALPFFVQFPWFHSVGGTPAKPFHPPCGLLDLRFGKFSTTENKKVLKNDQT